MIYNWQQKTWPDFTYVLQPIEGQLLEFAEQMGKISGSVNALSEDDKMDIAINSMVTEALKTSEIEGEYFSREDVMSSIRINLGIQAGQKKNIDLRASGISELMLSVAQDFDKPLSQAMLFRWHKMLMKGNQYVKAGVWRTYNEPMQVVSGPVGREKVHFEAPPSVQVPGEMKKFISWFNDSAPGGKNPIRHSGVRSAIAHLYFESIHPFEDGNGRIGRAISDKVISQHAGITLPISLSLSIEANKNEYYAQLKVAQKTNEITQWIEYFINTCLDAQERAEELINFTLRKTRLFDQHGSDMNERQLKVVRRMLKEGPDGFEGGMNAKKYMSMTKSSKATATRDLQDLKEKDILVVFGGGRSTRYRVNL